LNVVSGSRSFSGLLNSIGNALLQQFKREHCRRGWRFQFSQSPSLPSGPLRAGRLMMENPPPNILLFGPLSFQSIFASPPGEPLPERLPEIAPGVSFSLHTKTYFFPPKIIGFFFLAPRLIKHYLARWPSPEELLLF